VIQICRALGLKRFAGRQIALADAAGPVSSMIRMRRRSAPCALAWAAPRLGYTASMQPILFTLAHHEAKRRVAQPPVRRHIEGELETPSMARPLAAVEPATAAQRAS